MVERYAKCDEVFVVGIGRTPFGRFDRRFANLKLGRLGAVAVNAALGRSNAQPSDVEEVVFGVNFPGEDRSVARQVALDAGIPDDRASYTIDRACCSSLTAVGLAARTVSLGLARVAVAGGVENLSGVPYVMSGARFGSRIGAPNVSDPLIVSCPYTGVPRAVQAGIEALEWGVSRQEQDEWSVRSHELYWRAFDRGLFDGELVATELTDTDGLTVTIAEDECPRRAVDLRTLMQLSTVYGSPTVTAGNAPNLSTGASCIVLMDRQTADDRGARLQARIVSSVQFAGDPQRIASIPAHTARLALNRAGIQLGEASVIEINEAFAAVPLVSTLVLADGDPEIAASIRNRTNCRGGAVAIGHPTSATGARLLMSVIQQLRERGGGYGLVSICGGIGEAEAMVVEVTD